MQLGAGTLLLGRNFLGKKKIFFFLLPSPHFSLTPPEPQEAMSTKEKLQKCKARTVSSRANSRPQATQPEPAGGRHFPCRPLAERTGVSKGDGENTKWKMSN